VPAPKDLSTEKLAALRSQTRRNSMLSRWAYSFATVALLFGLVACIIVLSFLSRTLERQSKDRLGVMTMGVGEIVAPALASGNIAAAAAAVERFASTNPVAYLYLEDVEGRVIAHWPGDLPRYLRRNFPSSTERALRGIDSEYQGLATYEVARRIGDGKLGFVHLAIWRQAISVEAYRVTAAIAAMTLIVLFGITGSFLLLSRSLIRPLTELVDQSSRLSNGEFEVALELQRVDEFGDIARSLERLRSSLRAVITRLDKGQLSQP
jgi:methyl-accepting chemotaxis protein